MPKNNDLLLYKRNNYKINLIHPGVDNLAAELQKYPEAIGDPFRVDLQRVKLVAFSTLYMTSYLAFVTPLPQLGKRVRNFHFLLKPIPPVVWIYLVVAYICILIIFCVLKIYTKNCKQSHLPQIVPKFGVSLFGHLLEQPTSLQAVPKFRIVLTTWFFTCIVIGTGYKSNIVSYLVQPKYVQPPSTFKQLFASKFNISRTHGFAKSGEEDFLKKLELLGVGRRNDTLQRITAFRKGFSPTGVRLWRYLGKFIFFVNQSFKHGNCKLFSVI